MSGKLIRPRTALSLGLSAAAALRPLGDVARTAARPLSCAPSSMLPSYLPVQTCPLRKLLTGAASGAFPRRECLFAAKLEPVFIRAGYFAPVISTDPVSEAEPLHTWAANHVG
jgi:hypothetical protein